MPFVITENCIKCKHTDCVAVCPVDCFYEGKEMLVINPDECIDCGLCEPECPVHAITPDSEVPEDQKMFIEWNAKMSKVWPNLNQKKEPLPEAEKWKNYPNKRQFLKDEE